LSTAAPRVTGARALPLFRDEAGKQGVPEPGLLVDEPLERLAAQDEGLCRFKGDRRRGMGRTIEQRQLTEEIAAAQRRDDRVDGTPGHRPPARASAARALHELSQCGDAHLV
jgi:hypothetical protein